MSSRFLQGDGYPILKRYNSSNALQATVNMPYVLDDSSNSYVRQYFAPYPDTDKLKHDMLDGSINQDKPLGYKFTCEIRYNIISATDLKAILNCILTCQGTTGQYLKLSPRHDSNIPGTEYKVIYDGNVSLISNNIFTHNVVLKFAGTELVATSLALDIPPIEIAP